MRQQGCCGRDGEIVVVTAIVQRAGGSATGQRGSCGSSEVSYFATTKLRPIIG